MKTVLTMFLLSFASWAITGEEIIEKMDVNRNYRSISYEGEMNITIGSQVRTKSMRISTLSDSITKAYVEYTNASDKGTRYLMLDDNLWIYFPEEDDIVKISGHLLKEGMMGSDVSYEDALESGTLSQKYSLEIVGDTLFKEKNCWILELNAVVKRVPYFKRKMIVSKDSYICWMEEMYSKNNKLLKVSEVLEVTLIDGRYWPVRSRVVNVLRKNSSTEFVMSNIVFDAPVDEALFTLRSLKK